MILQYNNINVIKFWWVGPTLYEDLEFQKIATVDSRQSAMLMSFTVALFMCRHGM